MHLMLLFIFHQNDQIYDEMLEIDWFELPLAYQRFYQLYVRSNQNPTLLTISGLHPLNVVTSVQVQRIQYTLSDLTISSLNFRFLFTDFS